MDAVVAAGLFVGSALVFARSVAFGFIPLDDPYHVTENPWVRSGFRSGGLAWAFTSYQGGNWHPLTWLSLMADSALSAGRPWAFHLSNVLLHAAAASVLFVALNRLTKRGARSAAVAALFAVHPLHVEVVAWVSERKELLAALFGFLSLAAYAAWVERPGRLRFAAVLAAFAASLAAKAMWVTLPLLLLVLDAWPLRRMEPDASGRIAETVRRRVLEKWPLFAMSLAAGVLALVAQRSAGAMAGLERLPPAERASIAASACVDYLLAAAWPSKLAVFYPLPEGSVPIGGAAVSAAAVLAVTAVALGYARRFPFLIAGWAWYLITLLPVAGIVQVGLQLRADRYTYVPLVGIFLAAVWGIAELARNALPDPRHAAARHMGLASAGVGAVTAFALVSVFQLERWRDGVTLFTHTVAVTGPNAVGRNCLGRAFLEKGDSAAAGAEFAEAVRLAPEFTDARSNLAGTLVLRGRVEEAIAEYRETLKRNPAHVLANSNLGRILLSRGEYQEAARCLAAAVAGRPQNAETRAALGAALLRLGRPQESLAPLREALRLEPERVDARVDLGIALAQSGDLPGAVRELDQVLRMEPANATARELLDRLATHPAGTR